MNEGRGPRPGYVGEAVVLSGRGLHTGQPCQLELQCEPGPVRLQGEGPSTTIRELSVVRADRGVAVMPARGGWRIDSVEHLLGALAGLGIRTGLLARVTGPEVPLLDGSASMLANALCRQGHSISEPRLRVVRSGEVVVGAASYRFDPAPRVEVEVAVDFSSHGLGRERAVWNGDPAVFLSEIAPARTFGFLSEHSSLLAADRAKGADPSSVVVFDALGRVLGSEHTTPGALARHKLLDLLGDFYLLGGPPVGKTTAQLPGHQGNIEALQRALTEQIVIDALGLSRCSGLR